ncbi:MAG: O-antigen ligase family protein [Elusimicrobiota bacterium]
MKITNINLRSFILFIPLILVTLLSGGRYPLQFTVFVLSVSALWGLKKYFLPHFPSVKMVGSQVFGIAGCMAVWFVITGIFNCKNVEAYIWQIVIMATVFTYSYFLFLCLPRIQGGSVAFELVITVIVLIEAMLGFYQYWGLHGMPVGTFTNTNHYAILLVTGILLALNSLMLKFSLTNALARIPLAGLFFMVLMLTHSRSAVLCLVLGLAVLVYYYWKKYGIAVLLAVSLAVIGFTPSVVVEKFVKTYDTDVYQNTAVRVEMIKIAFRAIAESPVVGHGVDGYLIKYRQLSNGVSITPINPVCYARESMFVHNEFLQLAVEYGLPMLVLFLYLLYTFFVSGGLSTVNIGYKTVAGCLLAQGMMEFNLHLPALLVLLLVIIVLSVTSESETSDMVVSWKIRTGINTGIVIIAIIAVMSVIPSLSKVLPWSIEKTLLQRFYDPGDVYSQIDDKYALAFTRLFELSPKKALYYNDYGEICPKMGIPSVFTLKYYNKALELEPLYLTARMNLALSYALIGEKQLALRELRKVEFIKKYIESTYDIKSLDEYSKRITYIDTQLYERVKQGCK